MESRRLFGPKGIVCPTRKQLANRTRCDNAWKSDKTYFGLQCAHSLRRPNVEKNDRTESLLESIRPLGAAIVVEWRLKL